MSTHRLVVPPHIEAVDDVANQVHAAVCGGPVNTRIHAALSEALLNAIIYGALGVERVSGDQRDPVEFYEKIAAAEASVGEGREVIVEIARALDDPRDHLVSILDPGNGFDWRTELAKVEPVDVETDHASWSLGGRGMRIILAGTKRAFWNSAGNEVTLRFRSPRASATQSSGAHPLPKRILVVDDDDGARDLLKRQLSASYFVEVARDAASALKSILKNPPDLVLIDMQMPGMTGLELVARLRELGALERTSTLLLTAQGSDEDLRSAAIEAGAIDFLAKPMGRRELLARVERTLAQSKKLAMVERERNALKDSLASAQTIAEALMPPPETIFSTATVSALVVPCSSVGGDVVDVLRLSAHTWAAFLVDVAGHGVGAALVATSTRAILRDHLFSLKDPLVEAVSALNARLSEDMLRTQQHAAIAAILVDERSRLLFALNAGCPPIVLAMLDGSVRFVASSAPPAGLVERVEYIVESFRIDELAAVCVLSDGVTEGFGSSADSLGALRRLTSWSSARSLPVFRRDEVEAKIARLGSDRDDASMIWVDIASAQEIAMRGVQ
jgi:phosphoserine phosphatase RsbU/P